MDDRRDLTSGDPLGGDDSPERARGSLFGDPARPEQPAAWPGSEPAGAPVAPERPGGYGGGPVPPGAFQPRPQRPGAPAPGTLAEYWRRAVAVLVDGVIVFVLGLILLSILGALLGDSGDDSDVAAWQAILGLLVGFVIVYPIIALVYFSSMMAATNGQTLGKLATGIRVQRSDGKKISFWWAAYREVLMKGIVLGIAGTITGGIAYLVDLLWPMWDKQNRALHDIVVDSRVVKARS